MTLEYLKLLFVFFVLVLPLASCDTDVSHKSYSKDIYGKCFELKQDSFLFRYVDTHAYDIALPGEFTGSAGEPTTISDYLEHPNAWWTTESYLKQNGNLWEYSKNEVVAVLPKGTRVRVVKIMKISSFEDSRITGFIEILDSPYKGLTFPTNLIVGPSDVPRVIVNEKALKLCDEPNS